MKPLREAVLRRPRSALLAWSIVTLGLVLAGLGVEGRLSQSTLTLPGTESARAMKLAEREFGESVTTPILLRGRARALDRQGPALVRHLRARPDARVLSPWDDAAGGQTLRPRPNAALILVAIDRPYGEAIDDVAPALRQQVEDLTGPPVRAHISGMAEIGSALKSESYGAARRAEKIAIPVLLIVLLLVFRSPFAAAIPAVSGLATVLSSFGAISLATRLFPVDTIATSLASMMGLALGVDYSLLLVSRFREELARGEPPDESARLAASRAGRTVVFAATALVAAMLVAVAIAPGDLLLSAAVGVIVATLLGAVAALVAMPAALVLIGTRIDRFRLSGRGRRGGPPRWLALPHRAVRQPAVAALLILALLGLAGAPALALETGPPDVRQLPADNTARKDFEAVRSVMGAGWTAPFEVVVAAKQGAITEPRRLRALDAWQDKVAHLDGVATVVGPGDLAVRARRLRRAPRRLAETQRELGKADSRLARLHAGLERAAGGVDRLRAGIADAARGADRLAGGADRAGVGSARLERALARAQQGAEDLTAGLAQAHDAADQLAAGAQTAGQGADRLREALEQLAAGARERFEPGAMKLAEGLRRGADGLGRLREPAATADREAREAFQALERMSVGKADPEYAAALESIGRASAALSGRDPVTGAPVKPGYDGLDAELGRAQAGAGEAAAGAELLAFGAGRLADGLTAAAAGAGRLAGGIGKLEDGNAALAAGLGRLAGGGARFGDGLDRLSAGAARLDGGLERLAAGGDRLEQGLSRGATRSRSLSSGLERASGGVARFRGRLASAQDIDLARQRRSSPRMFESGYFVLAALDGASPPQRERSTFAVNLARGGQAGRVLIVPETGPNEPKTRVVRSELNQASQRLEDRPDLAAALGGSSAQLADYDDATSAKLIWLILALALVSYVVLVPVFRSLLLPLIAVALNLLTVAACFGILALLFQGDAPLGGPGYIDAVAISAIYTVIFGLSIDYEVFLITRMHEHFEHHGSVEEAIVHGLDRTAGVVTGAAAIMTGVFLAFAMTDVANTKQFGVGLAVAVILDATVVRLLLLPALMRLAGDRCWWLPAPLERRLPRVAG